MTHCHDYEQHANSADVVELRSERDAAIRERDEARKRANEWLAQLHDAQKRVKVLERAVDNLASLVCAGSEDAMDFCYHCGAERIGCGDKCVETLKAWALSHAEKEPA